MTRIKRGGRELLVNDNEVAEYLEQGYSVIDNMGNVITHGQAVTYEQAIAQAQTLRQREKALTDSLKEANAKIAALEADNAGMQREIEDLRGQLADKDGKEQPAEPAAKGKPKK